MPLTVINNGTIRSHKVCVNSPYFEVILSLIVSESLVWAASGSCLIATHKRHFLARTHVIRGTDCPNRSTSAGLGRAEELSKKEKGILRNRNRCMTSHVFAETTHVVTAPCGVIYSKFHRNPFKEFWPPGSRYLAILITLFGFYNSFYCLASRDFMFTFVGSLPADWQWRQLSSARAATFSVKIVGS